MMFIAEKCETLTSANGKEFVSHMFVAKKR